MLKFPNVKVLDNTVNNQLLNEYRDKTCNVRQLERTFNKYEKRLKLNGCN
ncbi:MAG: hypothetical protein [Caudoviricetes sp.]|nr:MAG: hypothetical protein [Caudoviricetes sp.]